MLKTFMVEGLTAGAAAGDAGVSAPLDLLPKIVALVPEVGQVPATLRKYSSIATEVIEEGGFKFYVDRKAHINKYATSRAIHEDGSVGGNTIGPVTTAKFKKAKRDKFEFEMNKSWDTGYVYDKKKDPKVQEAKMLRQLGSLKNDLDEVRAADYYITIDAELSANKSSTYGKYVSSIDEKTIDAPDVLRALALTEAKTLDEAKLNAAKIVDMMFVMVTEQAAMGRKGSTHEGFPYARGTRKKLGQEFTITDAVIQLASLDPRFIQTGLSQDMVTKGAVASVNDVPVMKDDYMDSNATKFNIELSGTGTYSPVIKGEEMADEFALFDHPSKPTTANLLEGSGGFDTFATPFINLSRFAQVTVAAASN